MQRITPDGGTVAVHVTAADDSPTDLDALPAADAVIDGATVAPPLTVTKPGTGRYTATIPPGHPAAAQLGDILIRWTGLLAAAAWLRSTPVEVIGGWPFTVADVRAANHDLDDTTRYPNALIAAARAAAVDRAEQISKVAWTPRRRRVTVEPAAGHRRLLLPDVEATDLIAVTVDGVAEDLTEITLQPWGALDHPTGWHGRVVADYLHGYRACPAPVVDAIIDLTIRAVVGMGSRVPERATSVSTDVGTFRITLPGRDGPTGIPDIDAVLTQYGYGAVPAVG